MRKSSGHGGRSVGFGMRVVVATILIPTAAAAQHSTPDRDHTSIDVAPADAKPTRKESLPFRIRVSVLGATDSNVFDSATNVVGAVGTELGLATQIIIPFGNGLSFLGAFGGTAGYRDGLGTSVGKNSLKLVVTATTGIEAPIIGTPPVRGRRVREGAFPALRLGLELKQNLTSNPVFDEPKSKTDETLDTLDPNQSPDTVASQSDPGGQGGGTGETFSSPNTHYKPSGNGYLTLDATHALKFTANAGVARDFVELEYADTSPQYNEFLSGLIGKYWVWRRFMRVSGGATFERRWYDEVTFPDGTPKRLDTFGGKAGVDIRAQPITLNLGYDVRYQVNDGNSAPNRLSHRLHGRVLTQITSALSAVVEILYTDRVTLAVDALDSSRVVALAGLEGHVGSYADE